MNLEFTSASEDAAAALAELAALTRGRWGALVDGETDLLRTVLDGAGKPGAVLLAGSRGGRLREQIAAIRDSGARAFIVARTLDEAREGEAAGVDAVIAKGHEAGGWVGDDGAYVLLQQCVGELRSPVWAQGGIGLHTAAACAVAGAAGVVLDAQLLLARETPLGEAVRARIRSMDGSETVCLGSAAGGRLRVYTRPGLAAVEELDGLGSAPNAQHADWRAAARERVDWNDGVLAIGQDAAFAADLARRFVTVGGIAAALSDAVSEQCHAARREDPLRAGAPLALSHGTRQPIVQGPMTRVSDRAEFAAEVAEAGALPLLALALMRGPESAALLERTAELLGGRPWGVGILGFVPTELRVEQLEAIRSHRPPFALIAGGRPDQARGLEDDGIATYLHVPSPGLLRLYLGDGARRFVFEGRECGGHVGPRTSFVLWDTMIRVLLDQLGAGTDGSECHVLFAGGVHDARSAAMVAAAAAPLAARGVRVGVLVGTAYLFTEEAVRSGAITERFQEAAVAGDRTVLLETGPGHATRCLPSPFADEFERERRRLRGEGVAGDEQRLRLETLNIGRLRVATKGAERNPGAEGATAAELVAVEPADQWQRGMYMIGQVTALRNRVCTLADLHADISAGSSAWLAALPEPEPEPEPASPPADIAIVGIGSIMPGAPAFRTFWSNIVNKVDAVTEVPASRWDWRRYFDAERVTPDKVYSRWGGFVDDVPFDPVAFGMPPNSLRSIEPFQLLGLLAADAGLRDAGYADRPFDRERTSVILGAGGGGADLAVGYTVRSSLPALFGDGSAELSDALGDRLPQWTEDTFPGLLMNVAAGRIANRLDLGGTNYTVDAACASSLASIALAVRELQTGTSDVAVAGGVDAIQNPFAYLCFSKTQAFSPTGRCRPFDAAADGIAISEGFASVVLKRLGDAERDGDRIYALIRGVGSASDGRDRSLTAPRPEGQMRALRRAYAHACCSPATVGLVEAHGTGTVAGDRAEVHAISAVYAEAGARPQRCAIGSVKSMIGHTKATAGVAGLIKAALALHHKVLPPTIGVTAPNPKAEFPSSPFYVNTETRPWVHGTEDHPRRAAVSAFGFGGTNFHLVLEEYAGEFLGEHEMAVDPWPAELMLFRGASSHDLLASVTAVGDLLEAGAEPALGDLAATLAAEAGPARPRCPALAIVAESLGDLRAKLEQARELLGSPSERVHSPNGVHYCAQPLGCDSGVALLFPGQGAQSLDMGRELAVAFGEVRESFERADRVLEDRYEQPLSRYVLPPPRFGDDEERGRQAELTETDVAQPALGAVELGYLRLVRSFGVEPDMVAGHSYGEFVALAAAGSLDEDALLRLSEARGRFIKEGAQGESGAMAAVAAGPEALAPLLESGELVLANLNAPDQTVVSGPLAAVERALAWCAEHELRTRRLPVACGFHSACVEPARRRLAEELARTSIARPRVPVFSNTTAAPYPEEPAAMAELLGEHLVRPVEFVRQIEAMYEAGARVFLETGPGSSLTRLVDRILGERPHVATPMDQPGRPGLVQLLQCVASLGVEGVDVDAARLFRGRAVTRLNLRTLEPEGGRPQRSPTTWLVNGGKARPAAEPLTPTPPVRLEDLTMSNPRTNDQPQAAGASPAAVATSPPASTAPQPGARAGEVIAHYQQVMQQFLETERAVMLAYLGAPRPAVRPDAVPGVPLPALPAGPAANGSPPDAVAPDVSAPVAQAAPAAVAEPPPARAEPPRAPGEPPAPTASAPGDECAVDAGARLLEVVSERTGYPHELLDLDADLEADLGLDSIKRVEIAGTMLQELALPDGVELDVEQMTASRTLREAIGVLEGLVEQRGATEQPRPFESAPADGRIGRFVLRAVGAPAVTEHRELTGDGFVVIVDDGTGVGAELADRLGRRGERTVRVVAHTEAAAGEPGVEIADLGDRDSIARLRETLADRHGPAKALVHLAALGPAPGGHTTSLFLLAKALGEELEEAGGAGGAALLAATRMGGAFAVAGGANGLDPAHGAIPGLLKTLAHEWPGVRVKTVDLGPEGAAEDARRLDDELLAADGRVEVGYVDGQRTVLELAPAPLDDRDGAAPLDADSVVLVTGGARGITAEAALVLAARHRPTMILIGRTALLEEERATATLTGERDLKRALFEQLRKTGSEVQARTLEREYRRIVQSREVRENVARMRATGARVAYRTCDVSDPDALGAVVDAVYDEYGRIDGVIHGAGVIEDKLLRDKQLPSFERVLATKARAAMVLAAKLRPATLRFLVFFGSVVGRFGNRGQADYAAASEVLNKLAQDLDRRWDARVVTINWGPWLTSGMVTPEVRRQFADRGVELIPTDVGSRRLEEELRLGRKGEVEVLIGGVRESGPPQTNGAPVAGRAASPMLEVGASVERREDGGAEAVRTLDPARDLYLADHRLDGVPVFPFAGAMELMAATAAVARPELQVAGLRRIALLQGVTVEDGERTVRVVAVPAGASAGAEQMDVSVEPPDGEGRAHFRATVQLKERLEPTAAAPEPLAELAAFPLSVEEAYETYLFHGPLFRGITAVDGMDERGSSATLRPSVPAECLRDPDRSGRFSRTTGWLLDPVLVDCGLQMQVLWARVHWDVTLLPAQIEGFQRFCRPPASTAAVRHELRIRPVSRTPMCTADHWFYGPGGELVATLTGVQGVGSRALNRLASVTAG